MLLADDHGKLEDGLRGRWSIAAGDSCWWDRSWCRGDRFQTRAGDGDCEGPLKLGDSIEPALSAFSEDLVKEDGGGKSEETQYRGERREAGDSGGGCQVQRGAPCSIAYHAARPRGAKRGA